MRRKKIRKVSILPKTTSNAVRRVKNKNVSKPIIVPKKTQKSHYVITPELYYNNEEFHNKLPNHTEKLKFLKSLNSYAQNEFNKARKSGMPIINMVFFGHWGWVFSNMTEIYKNYSADKYKIISSVWPLEGSDVYQYWRIGNNHSREYLNNIGLHNKKHESFSRGIQMFHDSPYHESRFNTSFKINFLKSYHSLLCTSKEQFTWVNKNKLHDNPFYAPLGVDNRFKEKNKTSQKGKIKLGFIGRIYGCGFKGESRMIELASKLDRNKFEFVFLSPNASKVISAIRDLGFTVSETSSKSNKFLDTYKSLDVTLILSINEGTPLPLIESLKIGHTVISTDVGEAPVHLESEYLFDRKKPDIEKVVSLLNNIYDDRSILLKNKFKNTVKVKDLTWEAFSKNSFKMWDKIILEKRPPKNFKVNKKHITFLSWHNSLPGYIKNLYTQLTLPKSFISVEHIKPPRLLDRNLMNKDNSFVEKNIHGLISRLESLGTTHLVVWNGEFNDKDRGYQPKYLDYIKRYTNIKIIYTEHGWFPQNKTFMIDTEGTNGSSSISKSRIVPIGYPNEHSSKKREYDTMAIDPGERNYIYVPLQLNTDTQIVNHSPFFKDMKDLIEHVAKLFSTKIIIKVHPKDTLVNKRRYKEICSKYPHLKYVEDLNNIGWCKFADRVIAINSTSINEALLYNKPVMTYGINNFYDKGVTYTIKNISDTDHQQKFLEYSPDLIKVKNYINFLLFKQFNKENPNISKALTYFQ